MICCLFSLFHSHQLVKVILLSAQVIVFKLSLYFFRRANHTYLSIYINLNVSHLHVSGFFCLLSFLSASYFIGRACTRCRGVSCYQLLSPRTFSLIFFFTTLSRIPVSLPAWSVLCHVAVNQIVGVVFKE